ncbi:transcriptional regulator [Novosphingobium sp. PC22D]|uniref:RNA polymerase sigma factor n=1 Tax=Novosphingobium sp. PC22D TaxID=1962403 RepID=UPI000BF216CA|nr:sigma-70 family RNA polymerase sigma factor [Novosphingobium sp. PC22D]PEQ11768.1 transcriptional regulator [Novosphingobium sp. PC22D]
MVDDATLEAWFCREVFPLERALTRFIRRNWREESDVLDLRQEVYARVYEAARDGLPRQAGPFVFTVARNHLINCARRARIVSFDQVADLESMDIQPDVLTPDRHLAARDELRRFEAGLEKLPRQCREVVRLRKIEGLTTRETADRLSIARGTVEQQLVHGMRAVADFMRGGSGKVRRPTSKARARNQE